HYFSRFHSWLLWQPFVALSRHSENLTALIFVFGLPFIGAPAASLALSWWIVRRQAPQLAVWVVFGVAAVSLPGQMFVTNDSIWQQTMFWPVFVGLLVPLTPLQRMVLAGLAVFQLSHQVGILLLGGGMTAAIVVGAQVPQLRR